jgi:uncharacterized protein YjbI with pentapeptide repeats
MNKKEDSSNKCPICGSPTHKESKYCIFHASAEEKTEKEFKKALKEYVNKIKKEDGDYYFNEFIFVGNINFKVDLNITFFKNADFGGITFKGNTNFTGTTFGGNTNFTGTTFEGSANFESTTFKGNAYLSYMTFKEYANFPGITFEGNANFRDTTFKEYADFGGITFKGYADFGDITFKGYINFTGATFKRCANFRDTTFEGNADFTDTIFKGYPNFTGTTFRGNANFSGVTFEGGSDFSGATFEEDVDFGVESIVGEISFERIKVLSGKNFQLKVKNGKGKISFGRAYLENVYLELHLCVSLLVDFTNALLRNTKIKKEQIKNHILQEKKKEFSEAQQVYLFLKNNFHSIGQYNDESWAFKKERDMERKSNCHLKTLHKWLWSCFLNALYGYGEKPERVIVSAIAIIIIFAFVFMNFGIDASPQLGTIPKYNILKELFIGIRYGDLLVRLKDISLEQIKNCLYFSTVTFTTLGLGDFRPVEGWGRIFVGAEAFIGALMIALFIYTFARRTGGR